jgi:sugar lactone lactonase YvrE
MAFLPHLMRDLRQIVFRNAEQHAIPSMDGALSPNQRLDACTPIGDPVPDADDIAEGGDGAIYVSAGNRVLRLAGEGYRDRTVFAEFEGRAGGLACHPDGRLLVCVAGRGLAAVASGGKLSWLTQVEDQPLHCLTAVAAAKDGTVFACDGSSRNAADAWCYDLMQKNHLGRLVACGANLDAAKVLLGDLHYPHGVALSADGRFLWFTESWSHRVNRAAVEGRGIGRVETLIHNLPGYPGRLHAARGGGFWLSLFALRTHLVEFVLREDDYREEMMQTLPAAYWIAPALATSDDCLEPMQAGSIKALGIHKPWAPPRSYGLVVKIDDDGDAVESLHSRVGGRYHGISAAAETAQGLVIVSKGSGRVLLHQSGAKS